MSQLEPVELPRLTRPSEVRTWLTAQNFHPSKVLGQNFLIDDNILRILLETAALGPDDRVLEIGPGLGVVTQQLASQSRAVVAVEKDKRLGEHIANLFQGDDRLKLIRGDALDVDYRELVATHHLNKLVANLPYAVASRLLVELLKLEQGLERMVFTVQLEVAERICAKPDTADYGLLAIWSQLDYRARVAKKISRTCFLPRPQVTSAIVLMERTRERRAALRQPRLFDALIKQAFSHRRKQLGTSLANFDNSGEALAACGIDARRRPETLSVEEWIGLADNLAG